MGNKDDVAAANVVDDEILTDGNFEVERIGDVTITGYIDEAVEGITSVGDIDDVTLGLGEAVKLVAMTTVGLDSVTTMPSVVDGKSGEIPRDDSAGVSLVMTACVNIGSMDDKEVCARADIECTDNVCEVILLLIDEVCSITDDKFCDSSTLEGTRKLYTCVSIENILDETALVCPTVIDCVPTKPTPDELACLDEDCS